jgi:two-component system, chemotaxis family, CheB/CheR fusion protein
VQSDWQGADLAALTRMQIEPYTSDGADRLSIAGPPISLPAHLATPFGLVLHELATNAAKYGSLTERTGSVHVTWSLSQRNGQRHIELEWKERGGPAPSEPDHRGLGSVLIENGIPRPSCIANSAMVACSARFRCLCPRRRRKTMKSPASAGRTPPC